MNKILDHGYCKLVDSWGSDQAIVEGARMSTDKGFIGWGGAPCPECDAAGRLDQTDRLFKTYEHNEQALTCSTCKGTGKTIGDEKLLAYLWKNKHSTPFEMAGLTIEVQAPIFVFREWHRHRVPFGYSELSSRYAPLPDLDYLPTIDRCMVSGGSNKQARAHDGAIELTEQAALDWLDLLADHYARTQELYEHGLAIGIPKELARLPVAVARYSRMRATGNLRGWLSFLALRNAPTAQYEIRAFAQAVAKLLTDLFPRTMQVVSEAAP